MAEHESTEVKLEIGHVLLLPSLAAKE